MYVFKSFQLISHEIFHILLDLSVFLFLWHLSLSYQTHWAIPPRSSPLGFGTIAPSAKKWYNIVVLCRYMYYITVLGYLGTFAF
jgi:hypothetical protein